MPQGRDPGDGRANPSSGRIYLCASCNWQGGQLGAFTHHRRTHHPIRLVNGALVPCSCEVNCG
jgi:hypothetical protein